MTDLFSISPLLIVSLTPIVLMLLVVVRPQFKSSLFVSFLGIALALLTLAAIIDRPVLNIGRFFVADGFSNVCQAGLLLATLIVVLFSREWFASSKDSVAEYAIVLLISLAGAMTLVMSSHFLSFFVSLELMSIPIYTLVAYHVGQRRGLEAALKYLLLAGLSVAVLLFGIALLYSSFGTLEIDVLISQAQNQGATAMSLIGFALLLSGIAFKVGLVPFHMWLPDVYEGAPTPVTAYLTTVSKGAVLFFVLRVLSKISYSSLGDDSGNFHLAFLPTAAVLSMFIGSIMALKQQNLKRLLAYSSISQIGYMFIGVLSTGPQQISSTLFYAFGYFVAVLCAFGVLVAHARFDDENENIKTLEGLFFLRPFLAFSLTVALLSFTGLPLTVGFMGKFFVLLSSVDSNHWALAISLVLSSAIGFYAYFKVILLMATRGSVSAFPPIFKPTFSEAVVLALSVGVLYFGIMPGDLSRFISLASFT